MVPTTGLNDPKGLSIDKNGNIFIADKGNNQVVEVPWTGTSYGTQTTVATGLNNPNDVRVDKSGNVFIADWTNCRVAMVPWTGTSYGTLTTVASLSCNGWDNNYPAGLTEDTAGNIYITAYLIDWINGHDGGSINLLNLTAANFGWQSVGQTETTVIGFSFLAGTTLSSITATTQGTTGPEFTVVSGGSCATGTPYYAGNTCTVNVNFSPAATGLRTGALLLTNTSNALAGEAFLSGIGTGPAIAFNSGPSAVLPVTGLSSPEGTAVDAAGNVYIADYVNNRVVKLPWTGTGYGAQTTVGTHLSAPTAVALDGAGNVYIANSTGDPVRVSAVSGVQTTVGTGFDTPAAMAVDAYGNLYIADSGNNSVVMLPVDGSAQTTVGTGLSAPAGVAIDSIGNIYIADSGNNRVVMVPVSGSAETTVGTGLSDPHGLAVDAALNLYIADTGHNRVVMVPNGGSQTTLSISGLNHPYGLSVDASGNLYVADMDNNRALKMDRVDAPAVSFPDTLVNATSSPANVKVQNIGTQTLAFSGTVGVVLSDQVNFYLDTNTGDCISGTELNAGASCLIPTYFTPTKLGALPATITLTDNTLNATAATQTINLSGTGAAPAPTLASMSATSATAPGAAFTLTVTGTNFLSGSTVRWNGSSLATTYVSATELKAAVVAADLATGGAFPVTVVNPIPLTGPSNALTFTVSNPAPATTSLSPSSTPFGGAAFTLTVNGSNFVKTSVVEWNGSSRTTTFVSTTQLKAAILAADIATAGTFPVTVFNPTPGGGTSTALNFIVSLDNPVPTLTTLSPSSATAGGAAFTLTVTGTNFVAASIVKWNGASRTTTFVSATQLKAAILAGDIATAGTFPVTVFNPTPGGGTSTAQTFTVNNPAPTLSSISPISATAGGAAFTLTLAGTNFVSGSVVRWNGANRTTSYVTSTQLTAAILAADIATAGTFPVTVFNPTPGGGTSGAKNFTVNNPAPTLSSISPISATAGGAAFTLTLAGTNFVSGSVVRWNGANRTTSYVTSTQLTAAIPAADIATAGTFPVTVFNPTPGGGTSGAKNFTVNNPVPVATSLLPTSVTAGGSAFTLSVYGSRLRQRCGHPLEGNCGRHHLH